MKSTNNDPTTNASQSGKTSPAFSVVKIMPSGVSSEHWPGKIANCTRQGKNGQSLVVCMDQKEQSRGGYSMPNISEWPNDAAVCLSSQVLETDSIPQKYYLSPKASAGILRRAAKRGKILPEQLRTALEIAVSADGQKIT